MLSRCYYGVTSRKCRRVLKMNPWMLLLVLLLTIPTVILLWQLWPAGETGVRRQLLAVSKLEGPVLSTSKAHDELSALQQRSAMAMSAHVPAPKPSGPTPAPPSPPSLQQPPGPTPSPPKPSPTPSPTPKPSPTPSPTPKPSPTPRSDAPHPALRGSPVKDLTTQPQKELSSKLHPAYLKLIREYPFQPVRTEKGEFVNLILVRSPFRSKLQKELYQQYKDEILFVGISSFEDFPQVPPNPFSGKFPEDEYVGLFPGFLHMIREPEKVFPPHVKLLLMSQSDFSLPPPGPAVPKKYDFTFSGSDQDVHNDCVGWSSFAKNWTFVKQALEVMCSEFDIKGVLVATKDKQNRKACSIPESCKGKITQTQFLGQDGFFDYVRQSKFLFLPQVHDASPRVSTQALALDVPLLTNWHIMGGWKYVNEKTGEFFHDLSDFRESLKTILAKADRHEYEPRQWLMANYGDSISGARLREFIEQARMLDLARVHFACNLPGFGLSNLLMPWP
ncbi:unnamed protein product [Effrenium voratum]|nr:unnamed protein product [Effrenium voratum]